MARSPLILARHVAAAAALAGAAALAAGAASAQPAIPITVKSCTVLQAAKTAYPFWYPFGPVIVAGTPVVDGIRIVYTNTAPLPADRVAFEVNYRGDTQRVIDVGTFAPNVQIDHTFGNFSGDAYLGPNPNSCTARAVRYADGTIWRAP